jgi:hypothetical protein
MLQHVLVVVLLPVSVLLAQRFTSPAQLGSPPLIILIGFPLSGKTTLVESISSLRSTIVFVVGCLMLCALAPAQQQPRQLKADGHLLGETAEQFFSEGFVGDMIRACQEKDWKSVRKLSKKSEDASKTGAKDLCAKKQHANQQAISGARLEYSGSGDEKTMKVNTFTFDAGYLVKIDMVYTAPIANVEGYDTKSFGELFAGLRAAYGPPSKSYSEPVLNAYGVKYDAHRAVWMGTKDVISIIEQPGVNGRTEIIAETLAEYNRATQTPKAANPLQ